MYWKFLQNLLVHISTRSAEDRVIARPGICPDQSCLHCLRLVFTWRLVFTRMELLKQCTIFIVFTVAQQGRQETYVMVAAV